jgi:hypothetical protein
MAGLAALVQPPVVPSPPDRPDPLELQLEWHAPAGCPTAAEIDARLRSLLPGDPAGEGVLVVRGEITASPSGVDLVLVSTFRGQVERRELHAPDCRELGEATAVLLAVALEPTRTAEILEATPATVVPEAPRGAGESTAVATDEVRDEPAATQASARDEPPPRRRARRPYGGAVRIAGGLDAGGLPPLTGAVELAFVLEWPRARMEVHGAWLTPVLREIDGRGATFQLGAAGVSGCGRLFVRAVEFPLCAGIEAGALQARPDDLGSDAIERRPWVGAIAGVGVARAWGPVGVWAAVQGIGRVVGAEFQLEGQALLRQWPVTVRALLGIELRWSWKPGGRGQ